MESVTEKICELKSQQSTFPIAKFSLRFNSRNDLLIWINEDSPKHNKKNIHIHPLNICKMNFIRTKKPKN